MAMGVAATCPCLVNVSIGLSPQTLEALRTTHPGYDMATYGQGCAAHDAARRVVVHDAVPRRVLGPLARRPAVQHRLAVVGAGPAGLAFSTVAAKRGHTVDLYEASEKIGGQFNLAKQVPTGRRRA